MSLDDLHAVQESLEVAQEALQAATRDRDAAVQSAYRDCTRPVLSG